MIFHVGDGIYDKLSSRDVSKCFWDTTDEKAANIHEQCGLGVESILSESINRKTLDNITVLMICFKNFKQKLFPKNSKKEPVINGENVIEKNLKSPINNNKSTNSLNIMKNNRFTDKKHEQENQNNSQQSSKIHNPLKKISLLGNNNTIQTTYADLKRSLNSKYPHLSSENVIKGLAKKHNSYLLNKNNNISVTNFIKLNSVTPNGTSHSARTNDFGRRIDQILHNN